MMTFDIEFERQCEINSSIGEMLAEDRREVRARLAVCHHEHGFYTVQGERICRDCGKVVAVPPVPACGAA